MRDELSHEVGNIRCWERDMSDYLVIDLSNKIIVVHHCSWPLANESASALASLRMGFGNSNYSNLASLELGLVWTFYPTSPFAEVPYRAKGTAA